MHKTARALHTCKQCSRTYTLRTYALNCCWVRSCAAVPGTHPISDQHARTQQAALDRNHARTKGEDNV